MPPQCLRCLGANLVRSSESSTEIEFFECPACRRHYSKQSGCGLVYRWPNPIGIALYGYLFRSGSEANHLASAVRALTEDAKGDQIALRLREIELELQSPTQQVTLMLPGGEGSEIQCRTFLRLVADEMRNSLKSGA